MKLRIKSVLNHFARVTHDLAVSFSENRLLIVSGSLSFTTILSIIPLLAVSFSIFHAFGGIEKFYGYVEPFILENLTEGAGEQAMQAIRLYVGKAQSGAIGIGGLIGLILTSMSLLSSIENAMNAIWKVKNTRSVFQRIAAYWLLITLGPLALAVVIGLAGSGSFPLSKLLPSGIETFLITICLFYVVYKWAPATWVRSAPAFAAASFVAVFWNLAGLGFAIYTKKVVSYDKLYGSLGAIPVFMLWIFIIWLIVLCGTALSVALQKRQYGNSVQ
jgi:membrane protein